MKGTGLVFCQSQGTRLSRSLEPSISYKHSNNLGNYILDGHEPSRPDKGGQPDCQGWLTSYKTASCQTLSVRDAQLVTTLQVLIYLSLFFCIHVVIITLVILVHIYLASYPCEMRGAFHSTELCVLLYLKTQLHPKG